MKTLIKILCLSVLWFSCEEQNQDVYGCTVETACNFNPNANIFDDSCEYIIDECGDCGGDNEACSDNCGVPYGDNSTCDYCSESDIFLNFSNFSIIDDVGNFLGGDTTDWKCCSTQEGFIIDTITNQWWDIMPYQLYSGYPNPFQDSINFDIQYGSTNLSSFYIINQNGEIVDSIFDEQLFNIGYYSIKWGPSENIGGGLYRAILYIEDGTEVHCFGDVCYCPDNQNCDELCE